MRIAWSSASIAVEDRAPMIRFLADSIPQVDIVPEPAFFSGLADTLGEMETTVRTARRSLDAEALGTELRRSRLRWSDELSWNGPSSMSDLAEARRIHERIVALFTHEAAAARSLHRALCIVKL
jgi:hypothetical protein